MDHQQPVVFPNSAGSKLFGIVHEPDEAVREDVGVILLSPGVKSRVAPHRLYNKMARRLARRGFRVLRYDFDGLGDSDGRIMERMLPDLYRSIQLGRYVDDTNAAIDWMRRTYGHPRFLLAGLCGGAITGLLAADRSSDVVGVLGLGLPVMLDGSTVDAVQNMTAGQLTRIRHGYLRKLLTPGAWLRLLTFRTDYRLLVRSVLRPGQKDQKSAAMASGAAPVSRSVADNRNPLFAPAFEGVLSRGCRVLLLFSESDRLYWEFREKYADHHSAVLERYSDVVQVQVVNDANHVFTFTEWQLDMLSRVDAWMDDCFPAKAMAATAVMP